MIGERIHVGLDIGSRKIKAGAVVQKKRGGPQLIGVHESPGVCLEDNAIRDLNDFSDNIHQTLKSLSKKIGRKIKDVQLGMAGPLVQTRVSGTIIPLLDRGSKVITTGDVRRIHKQTCLLGLKTDEDVLHAFPQYYLIDDTTEAIHPVGLHGRRLETQCLMVLVKSNLKKNFIKAVNQAGFEAEHVFFSSYAAAEASLSEKNRMAGCVFVDIGASVTSLIVYKDERLRRAVILPMGGDHITEAIVKELGLPFDLAEDIKQSYGEAKDHGEERHEDILVKQEKTYKPLSRTVINRAIRPQVSALVDRIQKALEDPSLLRMLNAGMVVSGGSCLLPGFIEYIEERFPFEVRLGKVNIELNRLNRPAVYAAAVGLAQAACRDSDVIGGGGSNKLALSRKILERVQELYQEYF